LWPAIYRGGGLVHAGVSGDIEAFATGEDACLCVFDIDRTLTAKQAWKSKCPKALQAVSTQDTAYNGGTLMISELGQHLDSTFCKACYRGIVTAGQASGPGSDERAEILRRLGGTKYTRSDWWQDVGFDTTAEVKSSLVVQAKDAFKQEAVKSMLKWWKADQHIEFKPENVHMFDDVRANVEPFKGTGFNAVQVSCQVRGVKEWDGMFDGQVGGCGGEIAEAVAEKGIKVC